MKVLLPAVVLATSACMAMGNPDGPFSDGASDSVVDITYDDFATHIKSEEREFYVAMLFVTGDGRECYACPYYSKQYEDYVASYKQQHRGGQVYNQDQDAPLHFVRVNLDRYTDGIARDLRIQSVPALVVLPPGSNKPVRFGKGMIDDPEAKAIKKLLQTEVEAKKKFGKNSPAASRAVTRAERRRRQVTTQEEMEYDGFGINNQEFTMNNICKFMRVKGGMQMSVCPQDVPHDFQQKKKPQDLLKNVLMLVILGSAGVWLGRIFGIGVELFDPSKVDLQEKVFLSKCVEEGDEHNMVARRPAWEIYCGTVVFGGALAVYCLLTGGMYWNILNGVPWSGKTAVAPGSRQQYGSESVLLAMLSATGAISMILASHCLLPNFLDFTSKKNTPYYLTPKARSVVKFYGTIAGVAVWLFMFILILKMFLVKNQSYLWNTALGPFMNILRPR
eukprot:TRINITY_DN48258_c0_g1_i1.p1 TRINITY_DN48258_c0_g1~~TRINITY_DN48258_c0_g1_i1.p1  ORF type:complete len:463 (+),score=172.17 TRINITY_DN48258_c0_g1_i1:50-1390(+)